MAKKEILCAFGVDVDAVAGWLGSYGGEDSPLDISRGMFSGEVGSLRMLKLFEKYDIKTSWFIPGHSIETFPEQMQAVADAGHEIGVHGYSHENPISIDSAAHAVGPVIGREAPMQGLDSACAGEITNPQPRMAAPRSPVSLF